MWLTLHRWAGPMSLSHLSPWLCLIFAHDHCLVDARSYSLVVIMEHVNNTASQVPSRDWAMADWVSILLDLLLDMGIITDIPYWHLRNPEDMPHSCTCDCVQPWSLTISVLSAYLFLRLALRYEITHIGSTLMIFLTLSKWDRGIITAAKNWLVLYCLWHIESDYLLSYVT